jgi:hypothetical protein
MQACGGAHGLEVRSLGSPFDNPRVAWSKATQNWRPMESVRSWEKFNKNITLE